MANNKRVVISLFDKTGIMVQPWIEAGYTAYIVDNQHPESYGTNGITKNESLYKVHANLSLPWLCPVDKGEIAFVAAFPPCTHLAVSGAKWFKGKGLRKLSESISMFATAAEFCEWSGAPYLIENPVSNISSHWRKPDYYFDPFQYTGFCEKDNYTKKTCLWCGGGFKMPDFFKNNSLPKPDDRIHKASPGKDRSNLRSATPKGFAIAVFKANSDKKTQEGE